MQPYALFDYELEDVILAFYEESKGDLVYEQLERVHVLKPGKDGPYAPISLMGVDLLKRFKFNYRMPTLDL